MITIMYTLISILLLLGIVFSGLNLFKMISSGGFGLSLEDRKGINEIKELVSLKKKLEIAISEKYEDLSEKGKRKIQHLI